MLFSSAQIHSAGGATECGLQANRFLYLWLSTEAGLRPRPFHSTTAILAIYHGNLQQTHHGNQEKEKPASLHLFLRKEVNLFILNLKAIYIYCKKKYA